MAKKNEGGESSKSTAPVEEKKNGVSAAAEADDFLPAGWVEVSTSGAPIYKTEAGLAEGVDLEGVAYDTILCLGGMSDSQVWEAIVVKTSKPTIAFRGGERVEVAAGEDVIIAHEALLGEVARRAEHPKTAQYVKIRPAELKAHATKKGRNFWDFRIAFGPKVDREKEGLFRMPERLDIHEKLEEFVKSLAGKAPSETDAKSLAKFEVRKRQMVLAEARAVQQLSAAAAS